MGLLRTLVRHAELNRRFGIIHSLHGLSIEAHGPRCQVGELCALLPPGSEIPIDFQELQQQCLHPPQGLTKGDETIGADSNVRPLLAEVVGVHSDHITLMPYGSPRGLVAGSLVVALGDHSKVGVGDNLLGRVIDGFGQPLDSFPAPVPSTFRSIKGIPSNPMRRPRIDHVLETGVRTIDALLPLGRGQRVGIFSGSGVGKSTLLGMVARHVKADVNVIALIGERGREVREFIEKHLGSEGLKRSVVVVATADQPALARIRAAHAALAIAEHHREQGRHVLLTMDSITRLAMARREVGLSAGEPPTARGYTPSVFAELPELCERCGTSSSGGSITALLTVLVEGDDLNEPVSDALRAILDGHIVLSRHLAHQGQYPAIDVLKSASRLLPDLTTVEERLVIQEAVRVLALLERNRQMVELGAYEHGANPDLDAALACLQQLQVWLRQSEGGVPRATALDQLVAWQKTLHETVRNLQPQPELRSSIASASPTPRVHPTAPRPSGARGTSRVTS